MSAAARVLDGRTAIVVGTSANIGTGIALELARAGAAVGCVDHDPGLAAHAAGEVAALGARSHGLGIDATDPDAVAGAVREVAEALGPVDVLVNGAVVYAVQGVLSMSLQTWRRQLGIMLDSAFLFTGEVCRTLVAAGRPGAVVNLISTAGHQGEPGNIGYTTAKGGLLNMTRSAAMELAPYGIRVNSVTPTSTDPAEALERAARWGVPGPGPDVQASLAAAAEQIPLGFLPTPSDYGRAVVFLCSDAARTVTGIDLPVDAGSLARYWRTKPPGGP